jgi:anti-anti-sigma factor
MRSPDCEISQDGPVVVARLRGEIDLVNVPTIASLLRSGVTQDAVGLAVDLSDVRYLDSAGVQMLFQLAIDLATTRKGMIVALGQDSPLRTLLKITNLQEVAAIHDSLAEGCAALRAGDFLHY